MALPTRNPRPNSCKPFHCDLHGDLNIMEFRIFVQATKRLFGQPKFVTLPQEICERTPDTPAAQPAIRQVQAFKIRCFTIGKARLMQIVPDSVLKSRQNINIRVFLRLKVPHSRHFEGLLKRTPQDKSRKGGPNIKGSFWRAALFTM